jgi:hypothetical protein
LKFIPFLILFIIVIVPAFAIPLSDRTGLKNKFDIDVESNTYVIETVANFDIQSVKFDNNTLVFQISSGIQNNLVELQIPQNMTKGEIHLFLDKQKVAPKILTSQKISFVTLEFEGNGTHTLEVKSDFTNTEEPDAIPDESPDVLIIAIAAISAIVGIILYKRKSKIIR